MATVDQTSLRHVVARLEREDRFEINRQSIREVIGVDRDTRSVIRWIRKGLRPIVDGLVDGTKPRVTLDGYPTGKTYVTSRQAVRRFLIATNLVSSVLPKHKQNGRHG